LESERLIEESALSNLARADESLDAQVEQFWKIETSEALANSLPQFSVEDKRAVEIWEQSVELGLKGDIHLIMSLNYVRRLFPYVNSSVIFD